jgi:predicted ATPase
VYAAQLNPIAAVSEKKPPRRQLVLGLGAEARPKIRGGGFLHFIELDRPCGAREFPFSIPAIRKLKRLEFHPAVTFFIGENGSGKSTLLEAIAVKFGFSAEGGWKRRATEEIQPSSGLDRHLTLARHDYPSDAWFLRAESFYNVATEVEAIEEECPSKGPAFLAYGGKSLHAQSHGEAFLALLKERLQGDGVYLFDEPEAALSPQRQLSVLTLMHRLVYHRSQLVIATHSPILLAYPHARIYEFSERGINEIAYTDTEHYQVTKDFLNRHERMLELLIDEEEKDLEAKER